MDSRGPRLLSVQGSSLITLFLRAPGIYWQPVIQEPFPFCTVSLEEVAGLFTKSLRPKLRFYSGHL